MGALPGCFFFLPLKGEEDSGTVNCEGDVYEGPVLLSEDPTDSCRFVQVTGEEEWGSGILMTVRAPTEVELDEGDELELDIHQAGSDALCLESGAVSAHWDTVPAASSYVAEYDATCDDNCTVASPVKVTSVGIQFCDVNGDYPGQSDASTPDAPAEATYTMSRTGYDHSGKWWFTLLSRDSGEVCALLRYEPAPMAVRRYALALADETALQGSAKQYDLIDDAGLMFLTSATTLTVTPSGTNRVVEGSTGSSTLDDYYDLDGEWTFTPANGPGNGWTAQELHWGHKTCANLRASNP